MYFILLPIGIGLMIWAYRKTQWEIDSDWTGIGMMGLSLAFIPFLIMYINGK